MKKYIDSEAFFKVINTLPYKDTSYPDASVYNGAISDVADMLAHFPAADVQEVVRCRDCRHYHTGMFCEKWADLHPHAEEYPMVGSDGYCHYGEKK